MDLKQQQLWQRNLDLESEMTALGHRRILTQVYEGRSMISGPGKTIHKPGAIEAHQESHTSYGSSLIETSIDIVGYHLLEFVNDGDAAKRTRVRSLLKQFLDDTRRRFIPKHYTADEWQQESLYHMRVVAFIGLQGLIDSLSSKMKHTAAAMRIGRALEAELKFRYFAKHNPALWDIMTRDLDKKHDPNLFRRGETYSRAMRQDTSQKLDQWKGWNLGEVAVAGAKVLDLIRSSTDLVVFVKHKARRNKVVTHIQPTDATQKFMEEKIDTYGIRFPVFLPTIVTPKLWKHPLCGGYHSAAEVLKPVRMVKYGHSSPRSVDKLKNMFQKKDEMEGVYTAINAVQSTPWVINPVVHKVMKQAWIAGGRAIGKMPQYTDVSTLEHTFPLEPFDEEFRKDEARMLKFRRDRVKVYKSRVEQCSRVIQQLRIMSMAEKFAHEEAIYFPTQLDFRGRMYAMPSFLSPQGTDCAKGLLQFTHGCKLGSSGLKWLHIHVANMFGEDKISFDEREEWTLHNYEWIRLCVKDPFAHTEWMEAEKPWQFFAAISDLVHAVKSGALEDHVSQLPVTVDGTCNGLQHFSAMLRDPVGGAAVNLTPSDRPKDIYQLVSDKVTEKFRNMPNEPLAQQWLQYTFDRKATKRCVMILPYSGTLHAAKDHIAEYIKEREQKGPWEDDFAAGIFFAKHVWKTIEETVGSAGEVMRWLKLVTNEVTKAGDTMKWTTPLGFPVEQDNRQMDQFTIDLMLGQQVRYRPTLLKESERLDANSQRLGISPNFIHSLDAVCLMLTVNHCLGAGIRDYALVHDSYGVHAGKMERMYTILRQSFVEIYEYDVLEDFLVDTTKALPPATIERLRAAMPKRGTLDLNLIKQSPYFFA